MKIKDKDESKRIEQDVIFPFQTGICDNRRLPPTPRSAGAAPNMSGIQTSRSRGRFNYDQFLKGHQITKGRGGGQWSLMICYKHSNGAWRVSATVEIQPHSPENATLGWRPSELYAGPLCRDVSIREHLLCSGIGSAPRRKGEARDEVNTTPPARCGKVPTLSPTCQNTSSHLAPRSQKLRNSRRPRESAPKARRIGDKRATPPSN